MAIIFRDNRVAGTGTPGRPGLSAYEIAKEYGYKGTEEEFATNLINASNVQKYLADHNVDESAHPYILQLIDERIADSAKPDWNVNDPEDPAYIKNRTHYKEEKTGELILDLSWDGDYSNVEYIELGPMDYIYMGEICPPLEIIIGSTIEVVNSESGETYSYVVDESMIMTEDNLIGVINNNQLDIVVVTENSDLTA